MPEGRKFGTFEAVKNLLLAISVEKPLVVFLEDVHWIDKISEDLFTFFSRCILEHPILMVAAYRPEGSPPWDHGAHYQRLSLETLSSKSSVQLVRNIVAGVPLDSELEKTDRRQRQAETRSSSKRLSGSFLTGGTLLRPMTGTSATGP